MVTANSSRPPKDFAVTHTMPDAVTRRDFLYVATGVVGAAGAALATVPFIAQMNPSAEVAAASSIEVDIASIAEGQIVTVLWRKQPVFIRHRTPKEIEEARAVAVDELRDPQADDARVQKAEWLILIGICPHLGCVPSNQEHGPFGGWLCKCHGSQYDTSGRIRVGPSPRNLAVPPYKFLSDTRVQIG